MSPGQDAPQRPGPGGGEDASGGLVVGRARGAREAILVGRRHALEPRLSAALKRLDILTVHAVRDTTTAFETAAKSRFDIVLLDFEGFGDGADVVADILRAVAPTSWILDFRGIVRRRPDHAPVSMAHTHPMVFATG